MPPTSGGAWALRFTSLGLFTSIDTMPLAAYCDAYARWRAAAEALAGMAATDSETHGLVVRTADGNWRRNPLVKIAADAANDMVKFASHFGLTPIAGARLAAGVGRQPPGKFDGLLA